MASISNPPIAKEVPHKVPFGVVKGESRGDNAMDPPRYLHDPWFWLRDDKREDETILKHLRAENEYANHVTKDLADLRKTLYDEHISHLKESDSQVPFPYGPFIYFTRTEKGLSYRKHVRRSLGVGSETSGYPLASDIEEACDTDQLLLDENKIAEGTKHCDIRGVKPSDCHTRLAYSVDVTGDEVYSVRILDLPSDASGSTTVIEEDVVSKIAGSICWGPDKESYFYTTQDEAKRPYKIWYHKIGTPQSEDVLLFTENDTQYSCHVGKSKTGKYLFIATGSSETSEEWICDLKTVKTDFKPESFSLIQPRTFGLRYSADHVVVNGEDKFIIVTNADGAVENKICITDPSAPSYSNWKTILDYNPELFKGRKIADVEVFEKYIVIEGRENGITKLWIAPNGSLNGNLDETWKAIEMPHAVCDVGVSVNKAYKTDIFRITYSSLAQPYQWIDVTYDDALVTSSESVVHLNDFKCTTIKEQPVLEFDASAYGTSRRFAVAPDGTEIPISLVFRKEIWDEKEDKPKNGENTPTMLYGYGSYEICIDPGFHKMVLPYLDRGMVYAIAHIRGGGEMGRYWYEKEGKYLNKRNTFSDFIACAEHLVDNKMTSPQKIAIEGRSAGGLLMGSVVNMRPDLFKVVLAGVPFVDVMTTMSDPSIPLTTGEWEEWGNPNEYRYFDYMLSYSPYDNVREQGYPDIVVTAGLHDPRVAYWEPAKWVQKLRKLKTNDNYVILKMDLDSGHFSASDRYKYIREKAWEQAVILERLGLKDAKKFEKTLTSSL